MNEITDTTLKYKWKDLRERIKEENGLVYQCYEETRKFRVNEESILQRKKEEEELNNQILMRDYQPNNPPNEKMRRMCEHFGAAPFQCWENKGEDDNNQYGGYKPKKDPDVWEKPDDLPKYKKNNKGYNQPKKIERPGSKQIGGRPGSNAYGKKPSTAGNANQKKGGKDGKDDDKKDPKEGKSPFFLSVYPEGVGPDAELIDMIEKEVVEHNPAVSFEDIAELEGAKRTLQEAVILPLLMPDFFRGIRRPWKGVLLYGPVK